MNRKYLVIALIFLFFTAGCVDKIKNTVGDIGGMMGGPESTAEDFVGSVVSGEAEEATSMMVTRDLEPYNEVYSNRVTAYNALGRSIPYDNFDDYTVSSRSKTELSDSYMENLGVEEGYRVEVSLIIEFRGDEYKLDIPVEVVKVDGSWKVLYSN